MDEEGFSGMDGRTTIFDYWRLTCIQNWMNGQHFDGKLLSESQKALYQSYVQLLYIAGKEAAIAQGRFFDLMYANPQLDVNENRMYAFLRVYGQEVMLVVVNFSGKGQTADIRIPPEAFQHLHIPDNNAAKLTDLFTGKQSIGTLTFACPYRITVPRYSGKILKFEYQ
jgi:hypothetical protein